MYHFKFVITFQHAIPVPRYDKDFQAQKESIHVQILKEILYFCHPVKITPSVSEFFYYPEEADEQCGLKYFGSTVVLERQVESFSSCRMLADYFDVVVPLLRNLFPNIWDTSDAELIEPS
jgi:hypothetical protein